VQPYMSALASDGHKIRSVPWQAAYSAASLQVRSRRARFLRARELSRFATLHVPVIPRGHYPDLSALASAGDGLLDEVTAQAHVVASQEDIADAGYRIVFNTGPDGRTRARAHHRRQADDVAARMRRAGSADSMTGMSARERGRQGKGH